MRWRGLLGPLVSLAFVIVAAHFIHGGEKTAIAWSSLLFFASTAVIWAYFLATGRADIPRFNDLLGAMEKELGISPGWSIEIMVPAFEPIHRVLFERAGPTSTDK